MIRIHSLPAPFHLYPSATSRAISCPIRTPPLQFQYSMLRHWAQDLRTFSLPPIHLRGSHSPYILPRRESNVCCTCEHHTYSAELYPFMPYHISSRTHLKVVTNHKLPLECLSGFFMLGLYMSQDYHSKSMNLIVPGKLHFCHVHLHIRMKYLEGKLLINMKFPRNTYDIILYTALPQMNL